MVHIHCFPESPIMLDLMSLDERSLLFVIAYDSSNGALTNQLDVYASSGATPIISVRYSGLDPGVLYHKSGSCSCSNYTIEVWFSTFH